MEKKLQIYLLSSTHWDREWYQPFQQMRFRLADMMDNMIDTLEAQPDFALFCMDGQTIVLEDYLEAAPENADRLRALIASGRLKIGPWYIMPDELLVSGESIIQNFLKGRRIAKGYGVEPWKYGYLCDIFGHIAQMPQILRGFHIGGAYMGRGLGDKDWRGGFVWQAPDGSEVLAYLYTYATLTNKVSLLYGKPGYADALRAELEDHIRRSTTPVIVLADAADHAHIQPHTNDILNDIRALYPDAEVHHVSLEEVAAAMQPYRAQMPVMRGELVSTTRRQSEILRLVPHSISSYYPLKKRNDRCQNALEKLITPLYAVGRLLGAKDRPAMPALAWQYLLRNQPHDSICGCSVDQVHIDMQYRYDQVEEIGEALISRNTAPLFQAVQGKEGRSLALLNPLLYDWKAPVRLELPLPTDWPGYNEPSGNVRKPAFRLFDAQGKEIPYQIHGIRCGVLRRTVAQQTEIADMVDISFEAELPAFAAAAIEIRPDAHPVRHGMGAMRCGSTWADNGLLRVDVCADGTLTVTDHRTGKTYAGLNRFADDGEAGNGWFHDSPVDNALRIANAPVSVRRVSAGPAAVSFAVKQLLPLPKGRLEPETAELTLETTVTLWADKPCVHVEVDLDNTAADHRLQALFPTGADSETYTASQSYGWVQHKLGIDEATLSWDEPESPEKNMAGVLYHNGAQGGLAFVSPAGLHEGGVDEEGVMRITLLRSFSRVYLADQPEACKLLGKHKYQYAIVPMAADDDPTALLRAQEQMSVELPHQTQSGCAALGASLLKLKENRLLVSIVKAPEDGAQDALVVRLWNPSATTVEEVLETALPLCEACAVTLDETESAALPVCGKQVAIQAKPWEIVTLRLTIAK